jgi:membrane-associated phospholipid phosphatase
MKNLLIAGALSALALQSVHAQFTPDAESWHTWAISEIASFRLPEPPQGLRALAEAAQLEAMSAQRDQAAMDLIRYWDAGAPAYRWIQITQQEIARHNLGGPAATRAMSLVAVSINDATVAAWDTKYMYRRPRPVQFDSELVPFLDTPGSPSYPSEHAVTAAAASKVLAYLFPDRASDLQAMALDAGRSRLFAGTDFPSDVDAGMTLGGHVADAVVTWAKADGSDAVFAGSFPPAAGVWSSATPSFPLAGNWKTWTLNSGGEFRLAPPPVFGSLDMNAEIAGLKMFARTTETNHTAWFWQPGFIDPWVEIANQAIFEYRLDRNPPVAAQVYAASLVAMHDATIACWDTKYAYLEVRPIQADSAIQPLFATPQHPGYPSGHACASGAAGDVLGGIFPEGAASLTSRARDAGLSTFYSGIHFQNDVEQGLRLGQSIARRVLDRLRATPIPVSVF